MFIVLILGLVLIFAGAIALLIVGIGTLASLAPIIACVILAAILFKMVKNKAGNRKEN